MGRLPLAEFYDELVTTQRAFYLKHVGWRGAREVGPILAGLALRGQFNFIKSLFMLNRVFRPELLLADHRAPVTYEVPLPPPQDPAHRPSRTGLYIHPPRGRKGRAIDAATERFVEETRTGSSL
jgi:hypothetical protein